MKKILYGLVAVAISFSAMSQDAKPTEKKDSKQQHGRHKADGDAYKKLNLTQSQKQELKTINQDFKQQMQSLKTDDASKDSKVKREAIRKDHQQRINNILTADQKLKVAELRKDHPRKGKGGFQRNPKVSNEPVK